MEIIIKKCSVCGSKNMVNYRQNLIKTREQRMRECELEQRLAGDYDYYVGRSIDKAIDAFASYYVCLDCGHLDLYANEEIFANIQNQQSEVKEFGDYIDSLKSKLEQLEKFELPKHEKELVKMNFHLDDLKVQVADENISVKKHNYLLEEIKKTENALYDYTSRSAYTDCIEKIEQLKKEIKTGEHYKLDTIDIHSLNGNEDRQYQISVNKRLMELYLENHQ